MIKVNVKKIVNINKLRNFKNIFKNKSLNLFLILIIFINVALYKSAFNSKKSLATNHKIYESSINLGTANLEGLLLDKFNVEPNVSTSEYNNYVLLLIASPLVIELFALWKIVYGFRHRRPKKYLFLHFLTLQLFLAIPFTIAIITPSHVIADLEKQAQQDIVKQVSFLSSAEGLKQLSVKATPSEILGGILLSSDPPKIIDEDTDSQAVIQSFKIEEKDTFYRAVILPRQVLIKGDWSLNFEAFLFSNNVLVIEKPSRQFLALTLPVLSKKIVEGEVNTIAKDKKEPAFNVLSEGDYNVVQNEKSEKIKAEFLSYINDVKSSLADANKYIPILQSDKKSLEEERVSYKSRADKALAECKGYFGADGCRNEEDIVTKNIESIESDLRITNDNLQGWSDLKPKLVYALQLTQVAYEKFLKFPLTPELQAGVFDPPDTIYIKYYSSGDNLPSPTNYVQTGVHEYLHSWTYNTSLLLPTFLDEGFTDYLTLNSVQRYSNKQNIQTNYPEEVFVIQELIKTVPEDKLIASYFNQSESEIEKLIDSYYSKGTYKNLKVEGEKLTYLDPFDKQAKEQVTSEIIELLK